VTDSVRRLADDVRASVNSAMRTLRADLASAARDARTEAKEAGRSVRADARAAQGDGRSQLNAAEFAINDFRLQLRTELRTKAARGQLSEETVSTLSAGLDELRARVRATL